MKIKGNIRLMCRTLVSTSAMALALAMCGAANAQDQGSPPKATPSAEGDKDGLGEIVVTAQRREQRLDKVGLSITAYGSQQLQALGLKTATEVAQHTPGVILESTGGAGLNGNLTVRGVAATDYGSNQESPNAIYFDDIYISSPYESGIPTYDLDRVEILRGPQGTLFGRNSTGGLANFISKKPTEAAEGFADISYGSYNNIRAEGGIGGPIGDGTQYRISGLIEHADGWWKNSAGKATNETYNYALRGQIQTHLTPDLLVYAALSYDRSPKAATGTYGSIPTFVDSNGEVQPLPRDVDLYGTGAGNDFFGNRTTNPRHTAFNDFGYLKKERVSPTLRLEYDLGGGTKITSLTNYQHFKFKYREDCDGGPTNACDYISGQRLNQVSEELRIAGSTDRLNWIAGAYYLNIKQANSQYYSFPIYSGTDFGFTDLNPFRQNTTSESVFGQFDYSLNDKLKLTLGGRVIHDKKTFDSQVYFYELGTTVYDPPLLGYDFRPGTTSAATAKRWSWSGRAQIDYSPTSDQLLYASVSRGVKAPGFNSNIGATTTIEQTPFKGETMYAYEVGAKTKWFDHKLRVNASAFYYDYYDFQAFHFVGLTSLVTNNRARMYGGELEVVAVPMRGLTISAGAAYLKTRVKDVQKAYPLPGGSIADQQAVNAPKWSINASVQKRFDVGPNAVALIYDVNYVSARYSSVDNNFATLLPKSTIQNARISYEIKASKLDISLFCKNFTNAARQVQSFDDTAYFGNKIVTYSPPRWFGIEVRKDF